MSKRGRRQFATQASSPFSKPFKRNTSSKHPYGDDWPSISASIKKRDGYRCRAVDIGLPRCNAVYKPPFHHLLEAHHIIPYAKIKRHIPRLIITLCKDCHHLIHRRLFSDPITAKQKSGARKWK